MLASGTYGEAGLQEMLQQTLCWVAEYILGLLEINGNVILYCVIFAWEHIKVYWSLVEKGTLTLIVNAIACLKSQSKSNVWAMEP